MADNLKILKQNLDAAIDPAAGVGEILAQEHNDVFTEFINKSGRYTGLPFIAYKEVKNNVFSPGLMSWNSNQFNNTNDFQITFSQLTIDKNNLGRVLATLTLGAIVHFKDFVGRSAFLIYKGYTVDHDANGDIIYNVTVAGAGENSNYSYQPQEKEFCMIEFYNLSKPIDQNLIKNVQIKYFDMFNGPTWQEGGIELFWQTGGDDNFTLANNEVGIFYQKGQNNGGDVYDYEEIFIFKNGAGFWGVTTNGSIQPPLPVAQSDFVRIYKSQFATTMTTGIDNGTYPNDYLNKNFRLVKSTLTSDYLLALHKATAKRLDLVQILTSWSSRTDDGSGIDRRKLSKRIDGNYNLLSVTFQDFDALKLSSENLTYTLLIDRYRSHEWKGSTPVHRKSKFRHELKADLANNNRINEIVIDNETMILDFNQDFYFRAYNGKPDQLNVFPAPTGVSPKRQQVNNRGNGGITRKTGWVDLGFRIRIEDVNGWKYETRYLGFIRMLGVQETDNGGKLFRYITYVNRQY